VGGSVSTFVGELPFVQESAASTIPKEMNLKALLTFS
jgi:hypothetical protein